ncbi:MAG: hypothetical protein AAGK78_06775 [Planctomycetota bacterium]
MADSQHSFAFIASGNLHIARDGGSPDIVISPFAEQVVERHQQDLDRAAWKSGSSAWNSNEPFAGMFGMTPQSSPMPTVRSVDVGRDNDEQAALCYVLRTAHSSVLLRQTLADGYEQRLYHKQNFVGSDVCVHPFDDRVVMTVADAETQTAHLAVIKPDGGGLTIVTDGDCVDEAASWHVEEDGHCETLVYQSGGVGRDADGNFWQLGPRRVEKLDLETGRLDTLLDEEDYDFLMPRLMADDTLWFIRRPWQPHESPSAASRAMGLLSAPFVFVAALFQVVIGLSKLLKQEPPSTAGGPQPALPPPLMLYGQLVANAQPGKPVDSSQPPTAPKSWELVRLDADDEQTVIATGVVSYDVTPAGDCIYTDGSGVFSVRDGGKPQKLHHAVLVERVRWLA